MNRTAACEQPFTFSCGGATLVGLIHGADGTAKRGILVVVGGPQYRVGSHRQFVLLARALAEEGVPVMRFDHRGIGDSDEPFRGFEALNADIGAAIDAFLARCPAIREVVLWGLCDAASAILFYAHTDSRVAGIVVLNPWVRTQQSEARTYLRHYYWSRLRDPALWRAVVSGHLNVLEASWSFLRVLAQRFNPSQRSETKQASTSLAAGTLPERMALGLARFRGPVLLIMSGQDLTAREFEDSARASTAWRSLMVAARLTRRDLADADHTFSCRPWHDKVVAWTSEWLRSW